MGNLVAPHRASTSGLASPSVAPDGLPGWLADGIVGGVLLAIASSLSAWHRASWPHSPLWRHPVGGSAAAAPSCLTRPTRRVQTRMGLEADLLHLGLSEGVGHAIAQTGLAVAGLWLARQLQVDGELGVWSMLGLTNLPLVLQLAVALLILDLALYWQHRLFHELPKLWATHKVHHAVRSYGPTRAARHHPQSHGDHGHLDGLRFAGAPVVSLRWHSLRPPMAPSSTAARTCNWSTRRGLRSGRASLHHALDLHDHFGPNLTVWDQVPWHRLPLLRHMLRIRHTTFYRGAEPGPAHIGLEETPMPASGSLLRAWAIQVVQPLGRWWAPPAVGELPADGHPG